MSIADSLKSALSGLGALQGGLRGVRQQLEAAKREREDVACAPACRSDVKAIIDRWIDSCSERYEDRLRSQLAIVMRKPGSFDDLDSQTARNFLAVLSVAPHSGGAPDARSVDVALMALLGQQLKPAVHRVIDDMDWPAAEGLPMIDRARRLAALDKQIAQLEADEAELVNLAAAHRIILD